MNDAIKIIPSGGVTSPKGFCAGAVAAGIKKKVAGALDLAILSAGKPVPAAGVFTRNVFRAAPVILSEKRLERGRIAAVIVNSGCANASTGEAGYRDAEVMAMMAARRFGLEPEDVIVASTGVIGQRLPMEKIEDGIKRLNCTPEGGKDFARAIMTTDTAPKEIAVSADNFILGGCAKGSGMIHPDMATMLAFITTDAPVDAIFLKQVLKNASNASFNMLTIDGDTSTNDMALVMASGAAGGDIITASSAKAELFQQALTTVCIELAKMIAKDGEGATRRIEVIVKGATCLEDARKVARTIAGSSLVKTAIHGTDPNWGRIMAAAGRSGAYIEPEKATLEMGGACLFRHGVPQPFNRVEISNNLCRDEVFIILDLGLGNSQATAWGCDLTKEYVTINADYTT